MSQVRGFDVPVISARRAVADLLWRIQEIRAANAHEPDGTYRKQDNNAAVRLYEGLLDGWRAELDEQRRQEIAHAARLHCIHAELAEKHHTRYKRLLAERKSEGNQEGAA